MTPPDAMPPMAGDVLVQAATNALVAHAADVASLRAHAATLRQIIEAAFSAMDVLGAGDEVAASVPGYAEWRAKKEPR